MVATSENLDVKGVTTVTIAPTSSGPEPTAPVAQNLPELLGWAVDCLTQVQDVLSELTKALSAGGHEDDFEAVAARRRAAGRSLTAREQRVLTLMAGGLSNREIARVMDISDKTAKNYVHALFLKLGVTSRTRAAFTALSEGLVNPAECGRVRAETGGRAGPATLRGHDGGGTAVRPSARSAAVLDGAARRRGAHR
ncbi:response regulator transcription factor [Amycolatopsis sp. NPDC051716]|uniref:response regulator transcription factor n=1 Tax=Amycolatopsis sp. NPDC051716 TaxID=3155804 RepID=UPI00342090D8